MRLYHRIDKMKKTYEFVYVDYDGHCNTAWIYAKDDETAAYLFNKVYADNCREVVSQRGS